MTDPKAPAFDPLDVFLDRDLPFALAFTAASAATVWALAVAARTSEPRRRRGFTGLEAAGMFVARRRRAAQRRGSSS